MSSKLTKFLIAFAALVMTGVAIYALWIEPYEVDVTKHNFNNRGHKSFLTLVQLSDLHLQRYGEHEQALATKVRKLGADVIVLSGDAIDRVEALPALRNFVDALGGAPVLLIPGNWEHWSQVNFDQLSSSGVKLLLNEQWTLKTNDLHIEIVGMDDFTAGQPDLQLLTKREISESAPRRVLVQHSPGFFDHELAIKQMPEKAFDLCLSGHTHGGQITLFGWAPLRPRGSGKYIEGMYATKGCPLYVSRGIGTSVLPLRFGSKPEIVVFEF